MTNRNSTAKIACNVTLSFAAVLVLGSVAGAQNVEIRGVINGRTGATITVQTQESGNVVVVLSDYTQVEDVAGLFHARKKHMNLTVLELGLQVQVQGSYNGQNQLVANTIEFNGKDLQTATDVEAGVAPVEQQEEVQEQQEEMQEQQAGKQEGQIQQQEQAMAQQQRAIAQQQQEMAQQQQAMAQQQQEISAAQAKIAAEKQAIAAINKRFGELADYNIWDSITVYFGNDKVAVDPQYGRQLLALCQKAQTLTGYVIQVKGYASAVGSAALNEKLSQQRAANVTEFLEQQGQIPLTNILAPGAMGTSKQVAPDCTSEGQAENRRVVVRVLQNKGIAGNRPCDCANRRASNRISDWFSRKLVVTLVMNA